MEHWWNDTDRGKLRYSAENLSQWHIVHLKSHIELPGLDTAVLGERPTTNPLLVFSRRRTVFSAEEL
jgi:hypothetical protein